MLGTMYGNACMAARRALGGPAASVGPARPASRSLPARTRSQAETRAEARTEDTAEDAPSTSGLASEAPRARKDTLSKTAKDIATTFAPRASGSTGKNQAVKGSLLYEIFVWQGWLSAVAGGLLSFNLLFPSDHPDIARLLGMWSVWMLTVPSWRARECTAEEKDALNVLFLGMPVLNIMLPFVWKSFAFVWSADMVMLFLVYNWKNALRYLLP